MFSESPEKQQDSAAWKLTRWWHWVIGLYLIALFTFLTPREKSLEFARLSEGSISHEKIIAPFDFEVMKPQDVLEEERREAAEKIVPIVIRVDSIGKGNRREMLRLSQELFQALLGFPESYFQGLEDSASKITPEEEQAIQKAYDNINGGFGIKLPEATWRILAVLYQFDQRKSPGAFFNFFESVLDPLLRDVYNQGIINVPKENLLNPTNQVMMQYEGEEAPLELSRMLSLPEVLDRISKSLSQQHLEANYTPGIVIAAQELARAFIAPNVIYNEIETNARREAAIRRVATADGLVKKDELIIDKNIRVTQEHLAKLRSLAVKQREMDLERGGFRVLLPIAATVVIFSIVVGLLWICIALTRQPIWRQWKYIVLIALVFSLVHIFQACVPVGMGLSRFLFPAALLAMLLGILIDRSVALLSVVAMAMVSGLLRGNDFPAAVSALVIGSVTILAVRYIKTRGDVMAVTVYLGLTYALLVPALHFGRFTSDSPLWMDFIVAGANAVLAPILVLGLIYIFENLFRITTDLSLLELIDLNRPLLRELAMKSPGTYHHSIMVSSLAESAARAIGANALLTRAGAYYHDIGKIENREYFIENQETGSENIHDKLPPSKSAQMVIKHVARGLELAEKHRLPEQIKAFISEHHGKSRLAYFYAKAVKELGEDVDEQKFRYPGPDPHSKETGILMLADVVEAAARSLDSKNQEELEKTVSKLIKARLADGDMDECPLTIKEVAAIQKAFIQVLTGIYHQRIAYPGQTTEESDQETTGEQPLAEKPGS